jgi:tRNA 2-thiouridine synthesizing protein A
LNAGITPVQTLDTKGLACPMPVVKLAGAIKKIEVGQIIEVLATDPGTLADFPAWAAQTGNEVLEHSKDGNVLKFLIARRV